MIKSVGEFTYGTNNITLHSWGEGSNVHIGNYCSIAKRCNLYLGGNHFHERVSTYPFFIVSRGNEMLYPEIQSYQKSYSNGDIVIGNDVWIGDNVTIMSGIKIGNGAVLATNSTIVKDVPDYTIVGGNPGKIIKCRFTETQIEALLKIKWWDWSLEKIKENILLINSENIDDFIEKCHI